MYSNNGFGAELSLLLKARGISVSSLARDMGLKSKTVVFRVLHNECLYATAADFLEKLKAHAPLALTAAEKRRLEDALEITRVGQDAYYINRAFRRLLGCAPEDGQEAAIAVTGIEGVRDLDGLLAVYQQAHSLKITILGLCDRRIIRRIYDLISSHSGGVSVEHFLAYDRQRPDIINAVTAARPILFSRAYHVRAVDNRDAGYWNWLFRSEVILCRWMDRTGAEHYHKLARLDRDRLSGCAFSGSEELDYIGRLIAEKRGGMPSLKTDFGDAAALIEGGAAGEDAGTGARAEVFSGRTEPAAGGSKDFFQRYINYTDRNRILEKGCNIYSIRPTIPLACILPDLTKAALIDGLRAMGVGYGEDLQRGIEQLQQIQEQRFDNMFTGRKVLHNIWSRQKMAVFARTGRTTDHFFGMRSYTPEERVHILSFLMEQNRINPYFNVYFARPGVLADDLEIGCFEGVGTLLLRADTSYDLERDHSEVLIRDDAFDEHFREYYRSQLLAHGVEDAQETNEIFRQLIAIAQESD